MPSASENATGYTLAMPLEPIGRPSNLASCIPCLHFRAAHNKFLTQAKRYGLPGGEEEKEALEDAAAPTDIPRLFAPGRLLYLSQQGESRADMWH